MSIRVTPDERAFALDPAAEERLRNRVNRALAEVRRTGPGAVAAVTVPIPALDLSAAVLAARRADDRFACLEQPDRDGFVLAGLGQAAVLEARGAGRFAQVATAARELAGKAFTDDPADDPSRPLASGPVFVGGFAFADDGGSSPEWTGLPPALPGAAGDRAEPAGARSPHDPHRCRSAR